MYLYIMYCGICELRNYPGIGLGAHSYYILDRKMVCKTCMTKSIAKLKKDKIKWYCSVQTILQSKLYNNESLLANHILSYIGMSSKIDIEKGHICSYCSKFMWEFHHNINDTFYYFICSDCLKN